MTNRLTRQDLKRIIQEEIQRALAEDIDSQVELGSMGPIDGLDQGLRVREEASGLLYTIRSVMGDTILLQSADSGETFEVSRDELEKHYKLD